MCLVSKVDALLSKPPFCWKVYRRLRQCAMTLVFSSISQLARQAVFLMSLIIILVYFVGWKLNCGWPCSPQSRRTYCSQLTTLPHSFIEHWTHLCCQIVRKFVIEYSLGQNGRLPGYLNLLIFDRCTCLCLTQNAAPSAPLLWTTFHF